MHIHTPHNLELIRRSVKFVWLEGVGLCLGLCDPRPGICAGVSYY